MSVCKKYFREMIYEDMYQKMHYPTGNNCIIINILQLIF